MLLIPDDLGDPANILGLGLSACTPTPSWNRIASALAFTPATLARIRRGVRHLDADEVRRIAAAIEMDPLEFALRLVSAGSAAVHTARAPGSDARDLVPSRTLLDDADTVYNVRINVDPFLQAAADAHEYVDLVSAGVHVRIVVPDPQLTDASIMLRSFGTTTPVKRFRDWKGRLESAFESRADAIDERLNLYTVKSPGDLVGFAPGVSYVVIVREGMGIDGWVEVEGNDGRWRYALSTIQAELMGSWCQEGTSHWSAES